MTSEYTVEQLKDMLYEAQLEEQEAYIRHRERKEQQEALERQREERFDAIVMYGIVGVIVLVLSGLAILILLGMTGRI